MDLAFWRDVSIVFLSILTFIPMLIVLVILYFMVRGLNFVHVRLPNVLFRAQDISTMIRNRTESISDQVADPLVRAERERTRAAATLASLTPSDQRSSARKVEPTRESQN